MNAQRTGDAPFTQDRRREWELRRDEDLQRPYVEPRDDEWWFEAAGETLAGVLLVLLFVALCCARWPL